MLSRLLTLKEQAILAGLALAIFTGALALATRGSDQPGEKAVLLEVPVPRTPDVAAIPVAPAAPPAEAAEPPAPQIAVGIVGEIRRPGLYRLRKGARVSDLLKAASGPTSRADLADINLAASLFDASTLEVPAQGSLPPLNPPHYTISGTRRLSLAPAAPQENPRASVGTARPAQSSQQRPLNINAASQEQLETLPGIGPATAQKIIEYRRLHPFRRVDELLEVSGIGPAKFEDIRRLVSVW